MVAVSNFIGLAFGRCGRHMERVGRLWCVGYCAADALVMAVCKAVVVDIDTLASFGSFFSVISEVF